MRVQFSLALLASFTSTIAHAGANHANDSANHIFNAIHSSMRQWGSSLYHNGMSFFLASVPAGTQLYHMLQTQSPARNGSPLNQSMRCFLPECRFRRWVLILLHRVEIEVRSRWWVQKKTRNQAAIDAGWEGYYLPREDDSQVQQHDVKTIHSLTELFDILEGYK